MKHDKSPNPAGVAVFGPPAEVPQPDRGAHLVHQPWPTGRPGLGIRHALDTAKGVPVEIAPHRKDPRDGGRRNCDPIGLAAWKKLLANDGPAALVALGPLLAL